MSTLKPRNWKKSGCFHVLPSRYDFIYPMATTYSIIRCNYYCYYVWKLLLLTPEEKRCVAFGRTLRRNSFPNSSGVNICKKKKKKNTHTVLILLMLFWLVSPTCTASLAWERNVAWILNFALNPTCTLQQLKREFVQCMTCSDTGFILRAGSFQLSASDSRLYQPFEERIQI